MKAVVIFLSLTIACVSSQESFPPCKWTANQWATFKQCVGTQTNEVISRCVRQQTTAKDWNTTRNTICASQSKKEAVKNCLLKDSRTHASLMRCNNRISGQSSNRAG